MGKTPEKKKRRNAARTAKYLASGACRCGRKPRVTARHCEPCIFQALSLKHLGSRKRWSELMASLYSQQHRCYYTGLSIALGRDATIEHIEPISKAPNRAADITNIVWVHKDVNSMKGAMRVGEFLSLCKLVLENFGHKVLRDDL